MPLNFNPVVIMILCLGQAPYQGMDAPPGFEQVVQKFQRDWGTPKGYMRPLDDSGWKARMIAFREFAKIGDPAIPSLARMLGQGQTENRILAAQALFLMGADNASQALKAALNDKSPAVRLYALDALGRLENKDLVETIQSIRDKDSNRDVRDHAAFLLERDDKSDLAGLRKQLCDYDLEMMNTAIVGRAAPNFELNDFSGKKFRLADFKGKMPVVLVFVYGDT